MYQSLNETEVAEDDTELVKHIGQSFRFSAVEAKREEKIKVAHDEAMFGAPSLLPFVDTDIEVEEDSNKKQSTKTASATSLISDQALAQREYTLTKLGVIKEVIDDTAGATQGWFYMAI